jgi:hypothetical protein
VSRVLHGPGGLRRVPVRASTGRRSAMPRPRAVRSAEAVSGFGRDCRASEQALRRGPPKAAEARQVVPPPTPTSPEDRMHVLHRRTLTILLGALPLAGCATHSGRPEAPAGAVAAARPVIRATNEGSDWLDFYLIGETREWYLGRVAAGGKTWLSLPADLRRDGPRTLRLAVIAGAPRSLRAERDPRAVVTVQHSVGRCSASTGGSRIGSSRDCDHTRNRRRSTRRCRAAPSTRSLQTISAAAMSNARAGRRRSHARTTPPLGHPRVRSWRGPLVPPPRAFARTRPARSPDRTRS